MTLYAVTLQSFDHPSILAFWPTPGFQARLYSPVTRFLLNNRLTGSCHPLSASNRAGCLSGQRNIGPMPKVSRASQHGTIVMAGFGTHR